MKSIKPLGQFLGGKLKDDRMQQFLIRYYMKTHSKRVLRFERKANFQSTPCVGSQLELKNDCLCVEKIIYREDGGVVLVVKSENIEDFDAEEIIEEMTGVRGWQLASDDIAPEYRFRIIN